MRRGIVFSVALHTVLAAVLLAGAWLLPGTGPKEPEVVAEVELVEQNTPAVGTASAAPAAPAAAAPVTAAAASAAPTASLARPAAVPMPLPPPPPPPVPARPAPRQVIAANQAPAPAPQMEPSPPGPSGSSGTGLVSGNQIIPAALDKAVRNVPPAYPRQAVRAGEQGAVILKVHVGPDGSATAVEISSTSGYPLLDQVARRAVGHWHFIPARDGQKPVSSTMLLKIRFVLTNPEDGE